MENLQEPILTPLLLDNPPETYSWKVTAKPQTTRKIRAQSTSSSC